ncbi:protein phosphatase 1 regulatory subunit 12B isoform X1 [Monodelphis domestica]|uniref:Protein phosphatase 1 regulatory subunit n=1 Tax=Monodelphis domestica TaxID=13616 RepID=A0A5F8HE46_MONDO|nr:protein phosphatase 1 regulatory subunit 12B isoform X1 [Monodelphis domestica]
MAELEHLGGKRAESARVRRAEQLRRWRGSLTEQEPAERRGSGRQLQSSRRGGPRVRFEDGAVFLAACSSGDTDEVKRLLARGADINTVNVDGLTALHQACIDENLDMVKFLVENRANVNQQDNEGWTPLHAAASCGYLNIAEYFINHGASVATVNSEGEVPSDLAEEAAMKDLLLEQVKKQGVDLEQSRKEEEQQMLQDARQWLNSGKIEDVRQARSGATALHVAAAKGYSEVLRLLIQAGYELNVQDYDGWTPLHAAAHWGVKEACSILAEALCDMDIRNKLGQTPFDVADEGLVEHLEMLQKKQNVLRSEKETRNKLIEADLNGKLQSGLFKNKEKILYDEETLKSQEAEEEIKDSSSSSSEEEGEEEASESDTEKESDKKLEAVVNHSSSESKSSIMEQIPPPSQNIFSASPARRFSSSFFSKAEEPKDESPASWRLGLRKTGSHNMLSEVASPREALRDRGSSIYRSSSSPRISALLDNKEKERENKSYFSSLTPRRLNTASDIEEKENRESAVNLVRSGSYTRQLWRDEAKGNEPSQTGAPSTYVSTYLKSASFGRSSDPTSPYISANRNSSPATSPTTIGSSTSRGSQWQPASSCPTPISANTTASVHHGRTPYKLHTDPAVEKAADNVSSSTPLCVITNRPPPSTANGVTAANVLSTTGTDSSTEARERRRSYLTPVRDEEAESQRKARSRQARQTRRSTQGVTLTDLQEAERTFSRSRAERQSQEQLSEKTESGPEHLESGSEKQEPPTALTKETGETRQRGRRNLDEEPSYGRLRNLTQQDKSTIPVSPSESRSSLSIGSHLLRASRSSGLDSESSETATSTTKDMEKNESEDPDLDDQSSNKTSIRERRRPKERRRGTGINFWTKDGDEADGTEDLKESWHERLSRLESGSSSLTSTDTYSDRASAKARREARIASLTSRVEEDSQRDYKRLYESALTENQKLKTKLQEAQQELAEVKSKLEKVAQKQEKTSDRSTMLEMEKRERRALERKMSEMEEEMKNLHQLKQIQTLKQMNEQLQAENRALTRVVARLSVSMESSETQEL